MVKSFAETYRFSHSCCNPCKYCSYSFYNITISIVVTRSTKSLPALYKGNVETCSTASSVPVPGDPPRSHPADRISGSTPIHQSHYLNSTSLHQAPRFHLTQDMAQTLLLDLAQFNTRWNGNMWTAQIEDLNEICALPTIHDARTPGSCLSTAGTIVNYLEQKPHCHPHRRHGYLSYYAGALD